MSCKSAIYTVNSNTQALVATSTIELGTIIRRFGCNCNLISDAITIDGTGYYKIHATITGSPAATGALSITAYKDGTIIPGMTVSQTAASNAVVSVSLDGIVRQMCNCPNATSNIRFILNTAEATINNIAVSVEKL